MVTHLLSGIRSVAARTPASAADTERRAQNVRLLSVGLALLCAALLVYSTIFEPTAIDELILVAAGLGFVGVRALVARGAADWAARALVAVAIAAVALAVLSRGRFLMLPFYFALPLMVAGAVLRPREVVAASAATIGLTVALWWELAQNLAPILPPSALLVGPLLVNGAAGTLATFSASTAARALRAAEQGADQASQAQRALRESENYYRLIADHSSDLIALVDGQGRFLYASPSFGQVLGYAPVSLVGSYCSALLHPDDRPRADADADKARAAGAAQGSYRALTRAGEQVWLDMRMSLAHDEGEIYLLTVIRDITERRTLEARLQEAQKMEALGRLAGGVAHDFNNLLFVIGGGAELALACLAEGHPARAELDQVLAASRSATGLTRQLLAFARRQEIRPRRIDLAALLREAGGLLERLAGAEVRLATSAPDGLWPVLADPTQIEQVIINLAVNARDAMPGGGELRIGLENRRLDAAARQLGLPPGDYVSLEVRDTGAGMSPAVQQRIFEPFFSTKGPERGTGLGLATCYGIVTQSGGTITVHSAVGQGSTFTVLLPAAHG